MLVTCDGSGSVDIVVDGDVVGCGGSVSAVVVGGSVNVVVGCGGVDIVVGGDVGIGGIFGGDGVHHCDCVSTIFFRTIYLAVVHRLLLHTR